MERKKIFQTKIIAFVFLLMIVSGFLAADSVSAQGLVPCGNGNDPSQRCTICHLVLGFKGLIDYGFRIVIFLALVSLLAAGILYIVSTGDQGMIGTAKGVMKNTLIGFAFVLLGWLLVNTTILILGANVGIGQTGASWNSFTCDSTRTPMN